DPAHRRLRVGLGDGGGDGVITGVGRQVLVVVENPGLSAGLALVGHVDGGGRVIANQDGGQARGGNTLAREAFHLLPNLLTHTRRDRAPIDDRCGHGPLHATAHRREIGARSATSLRSERSLLKRMTTIPPGSMPVTTPSPNDGWATSSPSRN